MSRGMFTRLAVTNIKKNKGTYIPYMITCIVCISMLYIMLFIMANPGMNRMPGAGDIRMTMNMGILVVGIFSFIFLLYSNSFLMKRRQKEIGLYNILGMEKGHISKMMLLETVMTSAISLFSGILVGILGSKLALLLLLKLIHIPAQFGFYISVKGIEICAAAYGGIFLLILLNNLRRVHMSRPIELLQGSNVGEREPKAKWMIALIGFICLGSGYYIAITTESPIEAIPLFFLAVVLVMAGTYLVFTAGSIAVLKMLRWKKSFYYKMKNFTSVSGMIYRMKQNAVGLASICILSTGVLLMLSSTVCLNFGIEDIMHTRYPNDINITLRYLSLDEARNAARVLKEAVEREQIPYTKMEEEFHLDIACVMENGELVFRSPENISEITAGVLTVIPAAEYEIMTGQQAALEEGEILAYGGTEGENFRIMGNDFRVKSWLREWPMDSSYSVYGEIRAAVVTDADYNKIYELQKSAYGVDYMSDLTADIGIDVDGDAAAEAAYKEKLDKYLAELKETGAVPESAQVFNQSREANYVYFYSLYGGLLFLGILLGGMFLMGTAMIIYYKQMSEGYEDRERFEIMRKVGMSRKEVKSSIRRQILMVFFLPLLMAVLHITIAFPMVKRLLLLMNMANAKLFILCTAGTILVFAVVYGAIYCLTARSYYRILEKAE